MAKERIEKADSKIRRSVQTVLYETLLSLIKLLAPILPYTSEEVYQLLPNHKESIHLENNPEIKEYDDEELISMFDKFFKVKDDVYKLMEDARNEKLIGKSLEAKVYLTIDDSKFINYFKDTLKQLLIISKLELKEGEYNIKIEAFNGTRCERCWNLFDKEEMHDDLCERCYHVVNEK